MIAWDPDATLDARVPRAVAFPGTYLALGLRGRLAPKLPETGLFAWLFRPRAD